MIYVYIGVDGTAAWDEDEPTAEDKKAVAMNELEVLKVQNNVVYTYQNEEWVELDRAEMIGNYHAV